PARRGDGFLAGSAERSTAQAGLCGAHRQSEPPGQRAGAKAPARHLRDIRGRHDRLGHIVAADRGHQGASELMTRPAPPGLGGNFLEQWLVQRRVIGALLMREMLTRYGRRNIGFLWLFIEPMMVTLTVAAIWTARGFHQISDIPIVSFVITGYSGIQLWRNMSRRCINAIEPNQSLLRHRPVKMLDIYLAR